MQHIYKSGHKIQLAYRTNVWRLYIAMDKLKITKNTDKSTVISIRINTKIIDKFDKVAEKTDRTRNELIGIALQYALDNMELEE